MATGLACVYGRSSFRSWPNETGLAITVTHHPPGTSKWNRIEHRMFSFISINRRGRPLLSHQVIVQLMLQPKQKPASQPVFGVGLRYAVTCAADEMIE
jgi:Rhodopirellula transposase DDE domain